MTLFDSFVMVDWSAAGGPKLGKDSIWIGHGDGVGDAIAENVRTRAEARVRVRGLLRDHVAAGRRVLVGFDFPYGYPTGFAGALGLDGDEPWLAVWRALSQRIADDARNRSNRFAVGSALNRLVGPEPGPFWMRPESAATPQLPLRKPGFPYPVGAELLPEFRATELSLKRQRRHPKSTWQLAGAGSVGSQSLVGIPVVHALRDDRELSDISRVWPFEGGFAAPDEGDRPLVLHAEIWPGVVDVRTRPDEILDAAQVKALVAEFAGRDRRGSLAELFSPVGATAHAANQEGWILGA